MSSGWARSSCAGRAGASPIATTGATGSGRWGLGPRRFGRWREVTEPNTFGTHEFIRFCRLCDVEPYFAANVGTGSPEEYPAVGRVLQRAGRLDHAGRRARGQRRPRAAGHPLLGRGQRELGLRRQVHARGLLPRVSQVHRVASRVRSEALPDRRRAQQQRPRLDPAFLHQVGRRRTGRRSRAGPRTTTAGRPAMP